MEEVAPGVPRGLRAGFVHPMRCVLHAQRVTDMVDGRTRSIVKDATNVLAIWLPWARAVPAETNTRSPQAQHLRTAASIFEDSTGFDRLPVSSDLRPSSLEPKRILLGSNCCLRGVRNILTGIRGNRVY